MAVRPSIIGDIRHRVSLLPAVFSSHMQLVCRSITSANVHNWKPLSAGMDNWNRFGEISPKRFRFVMVPDRKAVQQGRYICFLPMAYANPLEDSLSEKQYGNSHSPINKQKGTSSRCKKFPCFPKS